MTWEEVTRSYPEQWVIFEVEPAALRKGENVELKIVESNCDPFTILERCNELVHTEPRRSLTFAHTSWEHPRQGPPVRTLPTKRGIAL